MWPCVHVAMWLFVYVFICQIAYFSQFCIYNIYVSLRLFVYVSMCLCIYDYVSVLTSEDKNGDFDIIYKMKNGKTPYIGAKWSKFLLE